MCSIAIKMFAWHWVPVTVTALPFDTAINAIVMFWIKTTWSHLDRSQLVVSRLIIIYVHIQFDFLFSFVSLQFFLYSFLSSCGVCRYFYRHYCHHWWCRLTATSVVNKNMCVLKDEIIFVPKSQHHSKSYSVFWCTFFFFSVFCFIFLFLLSFPPFYSSFFSYMSFFSYSLNKILQFRLTSSQKYFNYTITWVMRNATTAVVDAWCRLHANPFNFNKLVMAQNCFLILCCCFCCGADIVIFLVVVIYSLLVMSS